MQATDITAQSVRQEMNIPKEKQAAYTKIVRAGLKVMFDPSTRQQTMDYMAGDGERATKMGEGIAAVLQFLFEESNQTMPPDLIIPAGTELVVHAYEVTNASGAPMSTDELAEAMGTMVEAVMTRFGVSAQDIQKMVGGMDSGAKPQGV